MEHQQLKAIILLFLLSFWLLQVVQASQPAGTEGTDTSTAEILLEGLDDARNVRISALGNLFIVETGRNRIIKTDRNGVRIDSVGRLGSGDYQFDVPVAIDPTNELKIYIADRNNRRIQVFDRRMQYLSTISMPYRTGLPSQYQPMNLTVDSSGRIYFFDEDRHVVYRFNSNGHYELDFELFSEEERIIPVSMTILDDELWVAGRRGNILHRFTARGSYIGFIYAPEPVSAVRTNGGYLWMLGNERVIRLSPAGNVLFAKKLPDAFYTVTGQQRSLRQQRTEWLSFDVRDDMIFLLSSTVLARMLKHE